MTRRKRVRARRARNAWARLARREEMRALADPASTLALREEWHATESHRSLTMRGPERRRLMRAARKLRVWSGGAR